MSLISLALKTTSHGCPKDQRPIVEFNPKLYFDNFQHFVTPLNIARCIDNSICQVPHKLESHCTQRAKFAKKVHIPPLRVNVINFELNGFNASIWVPWSPSDPKKSRCTDRSI